MSQAADRFIPRKTETSNYLIENGEGLGEYLGDVEFIDGALVLAPQILLSFVVASILNSATVLLIMVGLSIAIGGFILSATPDYMTFTEYINTFRDFRNRPDEYTKQYSDVITNNSETEDVEDNTVDHVPIDKIWDTENVIEMEDNSMIAGLKVYGKNIDNRGTSELQQEVSKFKKILDDLQGDKEMQLYIRMRDFDPSSHLIQLEKRRSQDPLFEEDPVMKEYMRRRIQTLNAYEDSSTIRENYILVRQSRGEVVQNLSSKTTTADNLEEGVPIIGPLLAGIYRYMLGQQVSGRMTEEEIRQEHIDSVRQIERNIKDGFQQQGFRVEDMKTDTFFDILYEEWRGEALRKEERKNLISTAQIPLGTADIRKTMEVDSQ